MTLLIQFRLEICNLVHDAVSRRNGIKMNVSSHILYKMLKMYQNGIASMLLYVYTIHEKYNIVFEPLIRFGN